MKIKFYDTSALIENIDNLDKDERIYISSISLLELEDLKRTNKASAQKVLRKLEDNEITATIVIYQTSDLDYLGDCGFEVNNDIKIICTALKLVDAIAEEEDELWFISNDFAQRQIAKLFISSERVISEYPPVPERYKGYLEVQMTNDEMSEFYSNLDYNFYNLLTNQYLLIYNEENECVDIYCWTGETHRPITYHTFDSKYFGRVKPYKDDIYQQMLFDSFAHNDVTLVCGKPGSGKSYNALAYLFHLLEKGKIDRIVVFCNPVVAKNAAKLGFMPGERDQKLLSSQIGGVLTSKLGSEIEVERLLDSEQLVLIPVGDARGYETPAHSGVYVLEAQNLDSSLLRLILQRVGEEAKVIVDGDYLEQLDLDVYAQDNGMRRMSEVFRGTDIYGQVELQHIHRSKIASIADNMKD